MTPKECICTIGQVELMQKLPMRRVPTSARWRIVEVDGKQTRDEIRLKEKFNSYAGVAELADAPDLGSGGKPWEFKSLRPHHNMLGINFSSEHIFLFIYNQINLRYTRFLWKRRLCLKNYSPNSFSYAKASPAPSL